MRFESNPRGICAGVPTAASYRAVSSNYGVTLRDDNCLIDVNAASGALSVWLPSCGSVPVGFTVTIRKSDSTTNKITVTPDGTNTIDGLSNNVLSAQYSHVALIATGAGWRVLSCWDYLQANQSTPTNIGTSAEFSNVCSFAIPRGNLWLASAAINLNINGATISTNSVVQISQYSGNTTTDHTVGEGVNFFAPTSTQASGSGVSERKFQITGASETLYLKVFSTYTSGPPQAYGRLCATRYR